MNCKHEGCARPTPRTKGPPPARPAPDHIARPIRPSTTPGLQQLQLSLRPLSLPTEIQLKIVHDVMDDLRHPGGLLPGPAQRQLSMVCSEWRAEIQKRSVRSIHPIDVQLTGRSEHFLAEIRRFPHLSALIDQWLCSFVGDEKAVFKVLPLLPNLKTVLFLPWSPTLAKLSPPPRYSPPALERLIMRITEEVNKDDDDYDDLDDYDKSDSYDSASPPATEPEAHESLGPDDRGGNNPGIGSDDDQLGPNDYRNDTATPRAGCVEIEAPSRAVSPPVVEPSEEAQDDGLSGASDSNAGPPIAADRSSTLADWFDFGSLRQVEMTGPIGSSFVVDTVLARLPDSLESFACHQAYGGSLLPLLTSVARLKGLKTLDVDPFDSTTMAAALDFNPLAMFPALTTLKYSHPDPAFLLELGHERLEKLIVGETLIRDDKWRFRSPSPDPAGFGHWTSTKLRPFVRALCQVVRAHPDRFPALRTVGCLPSGSAEDGCISFYDAQGRRAEGVREVARELADVGLTFVDEDDRPWEAEWFDEPPTKRKRTSSG